MTLFNHLDQSLEIWVFHLTLVGHTLYKDKCTDKCIWRDRGMHDKDIKTHTCYSDKENDWVRERKRQRETHSRIKQGVTPVLVFPWSSLILIDCSGKWTWVSWDCYFIWSVFKSSLQCQYVQYDELCQGKARKGNWMLLAWGWPWCTIYWETSDASVSSLFSLHDLIFRITSCVM